MLKKPEWLLSTTLVGTNIAVVSNTTMATALMIELFGEQNSWLAIVLVAPLIWIFGEIVPKSIFQQRADTITPRAIFLLRFSSYVFFPILIVFTADHARVHPAIRTGQSEVPLRCAKKFSPCCRCRPPKEISSPWRRAMIQRIFSFSETTAYEVMIPLIDVVAIEQGATCGRPFVGQGARSHIRLPVYTERVDKVVGVLNVWSFSMPIRNSPSSLCPRGSICPGL